MRTKAPAALLMTACLLAACGGGDKPAAKASPTPSPTASPTPTPTPVKVVPKLADFLTGSSPRRTAPVVAIKVDNSPLARPFHRGLRESAVIYQELVEGGSTRLLAVLESDVAGDTEVGPIRSVRESDVELLRQFGGVTVGFSGGNAGVLATFRNAARRGQVVDASYDAFPNAYRLAERRRDARNFFTSAKTLAGRRAGVGPRDIGLRFGPPAPGVATPSATARFSPQSALRIRYDAGSGRYVLTQAGTVIPVSPSNVIVQYVTIRASQYKDVNGNPTPYVDTRGNGKSVVMRSGQRYEGTWKRAGFGATSFRGANGRDVALKEGSTWVLLLPSSGSLAYS